MISLRGFYCTRVIVCYYFKCSLYLVAFLTYIFFNVSVFVSRRTFYHVLYEQEDDALYQMFSRHFGRRPSTLRWPRHGIQSGCEETREIFGGKFDHMFVWSSSDAKQQGFSARGPRYLREIVHNYFLYKKTKYKNE